VSAFGRAWLWVQEQLVFLVVLVVLAGAFSYLLLEPGRWGRATGVIAVALLLAALARAAAPTSWVGLLAVRGRAFDTLCYAFLGAALLAVDIRLHA